MVPQKFMFFSFFCAVVLFANGVESISTENVDGEVGPDWESSSVSTVPGSAAFPAKPILKPVQVPLEVINAEKKLARANRFDFYDEKPKRRFSFSGFDFNSRQPLTGDNVFKAKKGQVPEFKAFEDAADLNAASKYGWADENRASLDWTAMAEKDKDVIVRHDGTPKNNASKSKKRVSFPGADNMIHQTSSSE